MRLVTWNINSGRLRLPIVEKLARAVEPDVLCLQETKVDDPLFPYDAVKAMGFEHVAIRGMKNYNGVAILSKLPLRDIDSHDWCGKEDCRHVSAVLPNGAELHNLYVPAGGDEPDPLTNVKFDHKLKFLDAMTEWFPARGKASMIAVGDLNVAPLEHDVWSHKQLLKVVSHTPIEVEKFEAAMRAMGWVDSVRRFTPEAEKLYSWWSYRARDWSQSDRGRRLDHIWVTPDLEASLISASILREARGWEKPSDHAPVIVDLAD